jgi:hypothetical protein
MSKAPGLALSSEQSAASRILAADTKSKLFLTGITLTDGF